MLYDDRFILRRERKKEKKQRKRRRMERKKAGKKKQSTRGEQKTLHGLVNDCKCVLKDIQHCFALCTLCAQVVVLLEQVIEELLLVESCYQTVLHRLARVVDEQVHHGLGDKILDRLASNVEIGRDQGADQLRLHVLAFVQASVFVMVCRVVNLALKVNRLAVEDSLGHDHLLGHIVDVSRTVRAFLQSGSIHALLRSKKVIEEGIFAGSVGARVRSIQGGCGRVGGMVQMAELLTLTLPVASLCSLVDSEVGHGIAQSLLARLLSMAGRVTAIAGKNHVDSAQPSRALHVLLLLL